MSQDSRKEERGYKGINSVASDGSPQKNYEGFEGMNYEQVRQPYDPKYKGRNNNDERKDGQRPVES